MIRMGDVSRWLELVFAATILSFAVIPTCLSWYGLNPSGQALGALVVAIVVSLVIHYKYKNGEK